MRRLNISLLLIVGFLWMAPGAFAFNLDKGQDAEQSGMIEEIRRKRVYQEMIEEKKKLIKEAIPIREKRKTTLTPFVYDIPQEFMDSKRWTKTTEAENKLSPKIPSRLPPTASQTDMSKETSENILRNLIVMAVGIAGMILLLVYLRVKK